MEVDALRVLMLTQWFDPEPAFKGLVFARKLAERGHQVQVLTGFPNYPAGKLYPGYRLRAWKKEWIDGVSVVRVPLYPSHDRSPLRRACNYLSFAFSAALLGPWLTRRPDVIYAYHPPGTVGLPALALSWYFGAGLVYDVQDLWPDTISASGMLSNSVVVKLIGKFCRLVYRSADRVVTLSPGLRNTLIERGVPADRVTVIYNWAPEQEQGGRPPAPAGGRFRVVFAGNLGLAQGLDAVLDAAVLCQRTLPQACFQFVGGGIDRERLRHRAEQMRLGNVEFLEWQPSGAIPRILEQADALLVHLKDDSLFGITIPSKTQAYLAAGRPIIMAVRGDAADIVERAGAGVLAEPENPQSIAAAVCSLARMTVADRDELGRAGRRFYDRHLAMDPAVDSFDSVFRDAAASSSGTRLFDRLFALGALVLFTPLLAIVALSIRLRMGSPVFFRQRRIGRWNRPFELVKFRTMRESRGIDGALLPDGERLTALGRLLRAASLDELPSLWNVVRGDMSLVGPRPLLPEYLPRYTVMQKRRHDVSPGITGWAQIHGRNAISWRQKFELDLWYVENRSFWLDLRILVRTVLCVWNRNGIHQPGSATMPEFEGTENG